MSIVIDGSVYELALDDAELSVVEVARKNGVTVPTLCFLKECGNVGKCGLCAVTVNGKKALACRTIVQDGDEIVTTSEELDETLKKRISKMLESHNFSCGKCIRRENCEFLSLVQRTKARAEVLFRPTEEELASLFDDRSESLVIDRSKCVLCTRCVATCELRTRTESIVVGKVSAIDANGDEKVIRGVHASPNKGLPIGEQAPKNEGKPPCFDETNCLLCGQCLLSCPVAALQEKSHLQRVQEAIADESKHVIIAMAPSVRAGLGELFGEPIGTDVTGKIYTALREVGATKVFDINFSADVTIMEEGNELLQRLGIEANFDPETGKVNLETREPAGKLPMFTSCCPAWVRQVQNYFPELTGNLSSARSPQAIFGAASKVYYPKVAGVDVKDVFTVTIMPCIAKKYEAAIEEFNTDGFRDIDAVLTTRELAQLIKTSKNSDGNRIKFNELADSEADLLMGEYTGAGTIFGVSGGVMEAAIRTAKDFAENFKNERSESVDYSAVRGLSGIKDGTVSIETPNGTLDLKVAVVNGAANFFDLHASGKLDSYHFVEVMACSGGCVNGGGQPIVKAGDRLDLITDGTADHEGDLRKLRAKVLYNQDSDGIFAKHRKSHENPEVLAMYKELGNESGRGPGKGIAHKIFHHKY